MLIFTVFFGSLAKVPSDGIPHALFYFSALLPWIYFSGTLTNTGNSLVSNASIITKVYFPRVLLPASTALSGLLDFCIGSVLLLLLLGYYRIQPGWTLLLWPILAIPLVALSLGIGMILSALNVKYRDIKYVIPFAIQLLLFVTPIIYPASIVPARFRLLLALNPLTGIIEAFRYSLLPGRSLDWRETAVSGIITVVIFVSALLYFRKTEREFADIV
jgi:lipopolysaccharide transport system permease protein